ncbi:MAG: DEAD/DEAH box helicase [Alicyclobacillus sp.]|nr:DEAD/DEAH box helicase [Alicyclobacillus sp.]
MARGLISRAAIREALGTTLYERGRAYYNQGRVSLLVPTDAEFRTWTATVRGQRAYTVHVYIDGDVLRSTCDCPAFANSGGCKHVVAVLLKVADGHILRPDPATAATSETVPDAAAAAPEAPPADAWPEAAPAAVPASSRPDSTRLTQLLELFRGQAAAPSAASGRSASPPQDLVVEWSCHPVPSFRDVIGISMKVGPQRTYVVRKIREFLGAVADDRPYAFTPRFTYTPGQHRFNEIDGEIVRLLIEAMQEETYYQTLLHSYSTPTILDKDRTLSIPPKMWATLYPLLLQAHTVVETYGLLKPLRAAERPPVVARLEPHPNGHHALQFEGLDNLKVLPHYGVVLAHGTIYPMDRGAFERLLALQRLLRHSPDEAIAIPDEALPAVVSTVLPPLRQAAQVEVDPRIEDRMVEVPLTAKVYLDWRDDALVARVAFVYGELAIHPFADGAADGDVGGETADRILVRDSAKEMQVVQQLEQAQFAVRDGELWLFDEAQIYEFLYHRLPDLQAVAEVYATSRVDGKVRPPARPSARLELDRQTNWLEVSFDMDNLDEDEVRAVLWALVEKRRYHRLRDGSFVSLENQGFAELAKVVSNLGLEPRDLREKKRTATAADSGMSVRLPALRALPLIEGPSDAAPLSAVKLGRNLRQWLDNLRNPDNVEAKIPEGLRTTLRRYQVFGFQWMKTLAQYGFGGILADDMGLGKTVQTIAFLLSDKEERAATLLDKPAAAPSGTADLAGPPSLIVCPASLTYNWLHELETFAPGLRAAVVAGSAEDRERLLAAADAYDVLITSYPLLRRDADAYASRRFRALILDEAQAIKNHGTQTAQATRDIESDFRFALTGTPVENALDDLWSIFHTVFPELLGSHRAFAALSKEQVAKRVRPFILRRLKQDVLTELPEKIETLHTSELTADQKKLYLAYLARLQRETRENLARDGFQKERLRILAGLTRLRQICCHPALCVEGYNGESGKFEQLLELVDESIAGNHRMLIFSQFTSMLQLIRDALAARGIEHFYLDGETPAKERLRLCQEFNAGATPVFLISLKAGGTGLNLTGADTVILYDLWWNPAVEQQATDRAHRLGQKQTVQVVRMVTRGTIEEKMYELQKHKRDLIDMVVQAGSEGLTALTEEDVRELLQI